MESISDEDFVKFCRRDKVIKIAIAVDTKTGKIAMNQDPRDILFPQLIGILNSTQSRLLKAWWDAEIENK